MLMDLLREFILELLRALFWEELCQRVKERLLERARRRGLRRRQALLHWLRIRHRKQLLHRITTGAQKKL